MTTMDYETSADLYLGIGPGTARGLGYKRFSTAAAAIRFAMEEAAPVSLRGASLEVGDRRYSGADIPGLYNDPGYPLSRKPTRAAPPKPQ